MIEVLIRKGSALVGISCDLCHTMFSHCTEIHGLHCDADTTVAIAAAIRREAHESGWCPLHSAGEESFICACCRKDLVSRAGGPGGDPCVPA